MPALPFMMCHFVDRLRESFVDCVNVPFLFYIRIRQTILGCSVTLLFEKKCEDMRIFQVNVLFLSLRNSNLKLSSNWYVAFLKKCILETRPQKLDPLPNKSAIAEKFLTRKEFPTENPLKNDFSSQKLHCNQAFRHL